MQAAQAKAVPTGPDYPGNASAQRRATDNCRMLFCSPRPPHLYNWRAAVLASLLPLLLSPATWAKGPALNPGQALPPSIIKALVKAQVPPEAVSFLVVEANGQQPPRLRHRVDQAMNPASVMKLVTTYAALDSLGPDFTWITSVIADGTLSNGRLDGNLLVRGGGDPKLVVERLQGLLGQVQASGVREVRGDIVLDRSAFALPPPRPAEFDGEPLRPYNVQPDALLINFKSLVMTFTPDRAQDRVLVRSEPPLAGVQIDTSVPLLTTPCGDWRSGLRASLDQPLRVQFQGGYPLACGERVWPTAYADPASFAARAMEGSWRQLGGALSGTVRDATPAERSAWQRTGTVSGQKPPMRLDAPSLPLIDVLRDVNKFSNNVMAQHLLLTLGLQAKPPEQTPGSAEAGRAAVLAWWQKTLPAAPPPLVDNGSGLSRSERISAASLGALLTHAQHHRLAALFADTLPIAGVDATLRERLKGVAGQAFLKTGSLRDVSAVAGYAQSPGGPRFVVVGLINHPQASAARPALDALVQWALQQR